MSNDRLFHTIKQLQEGSQLDNVSPSIKRLAMHITKAEIDEFSKKLEENPKLRFLEFLQNNVPAFNANRKEIKIRKIAENKTSGNIDGMDVDNFSAFMLSKVLEMLDNNQKITLLNRPISEAIAISYKLAARAEFR